MYITCVDKCSDPPKLSFGSIGKQHQSMKAMKATLVVGGHVYDDSG